MDNFLFMAFAKGEVSKEASEVTRYIGFAPVKVLAFNPNKAQIKELMGFEPQEEPVYIGSQDVDGKKVDYVRLSFVVRTTEEPEVTQMLTYFIRNQYVKGSQSGKYFVGDHYGNTAWATEDVIKAKQTVMYSNGPAKLIGDYRPLYEGEIEVIRFLKEFIVLGSPGDTNGFNYVDGNWVPMPKADLDNNECYFTAEEVQKMFKGDFSTIKDAIALQPNNEVKVLFGIRTREDKEYQTIYPRVLRKKSSKLNIISDEITERKQAGALSNQIYEFVPLKEYKVEPTDFAAPAETESPW